MSKKIKKSFACARVEQYNLNSEIVPFYTPQIGDVAIFQVMKGNGHYLVDENAINRDIFDGDMIMAAFGSRYATSQLEGYVPSQPIEYCHLLGRGGVAGELKSVSALMRKEPSQIKLLGYATDAAGKIINTIQYDQLESFSPLTIKSKVILSIGSSMDSGKTTTAAYLCGGLSAAGHKTAYLKLTGTAFPKDGRFVYDRGADFVADFTHFGYPSTFLCDYKELLDLYQSLINLAQEAIDPEYIVVEIADGILQRETAMFLKDSRFMNTVHDVILSCGDSLGVMSALNILENMNIRPFAISGLFTASDLLVEEVKPLVNFPVLKLNDLLNGTALDYLQKVQYEDEATEF